MRVPRPPAVGLRLVALLAVCVVAGLAALAVVGRDRRATSSARRDQSLSLVAQALQTRSVSTTVDGVGIDISTPLLAGGSLAATGAGDPYQVTTTIAYVPPYGAIELGAIPYGKSNPSLSRHVATPGSAPAFRREIADSHAANLTFSRAVPAMLFGRQVEGQVTQTRETIAGILTVRLHAEWVTEAGGRVWILRLSADDLTDAQRGTLLDALAHVVLGGRGLDTPTTVTTVPPPPSPIRSTDDSFTVGLPPWWDGKECDGAYNGSHAVLASWNGLLACGPNVDLPSRSFSGSGAPRWTYEYEWECVELSKRYLWLRYGVPDQPGDGFATVDAEAPAAPMLVRYAPDGAHVPQAGDVISFGTTSPGHTAVVTSTDLGADGNGSYTTLNENVGGQAVITFDIRQWVPLTTHGGRSTGIPPVSDWLHDPTNTPGILGPGGIGKLAFGSGQVEQGGGASTAAATAPASLPAAATGFVRTPDGTEYRIAGGAPLLVTRCDGLGSGCSQPQAVVDLSQFGPYPQNGTFLRAGGAVFRVAGGAPLGIGDCGVVGGCGGAVDVDPAAVASLDHLRGAPVDGTVIQGMPSGAYWLISGGRRTPTAATASAVAVTDAAVAGILPAGAPTPSPTAPGATPTAPQGPSAAPPSLPILTRPFPVFPILLPTPTPVPPLRIIQLPPYVLQTPPPPRTIVPGPILLPPPPH